MINFVFKARQFFILNAIAVIIFASWEIQFTREYWDIVDIWFATNINAVLTQNNSLWNGFWAVFNMRVIDLAALISIALFFYFANILFAPKQRLAGLIGFVLLLGLMLAVREILDFYVDYNDLSRISPSLQLDTIMRLSLSYPNLDLKDASISSFPGDHGAVLITWLGYCLFCRRNNWSFAVFLVVIIFSLPRLVSGAHWLSDIAVGGVVIACITLAFGLYTPIFNALHKKITNLTFNLIKK